MINSSYKLVLVLLIVIGVIGCGKDSATGPEVGEPPTLPDLETVEPDFSFFQDNNFKQFSTSSEEYNNFYAAQSVVLGASFQLMVSSVYGSYISQAETTDAEYKDGQWVWSYSSSFEGVTAEYKITAQERSDGSVQWATYWSYNNGEDSIQDYKMFEGVVSADGSSGSWTFNTLQTETDEEIPLITSEWSTSSDTEKELSTVMYSEGEAETRIEYEEDRPEFTMTISGVNQEDVTVITWNTETETGSVTEDGTQKCWDSNFEDTPCS